MSSRTRVAGCFCVLIAGEVLHCAAAEGGLVLDRVSRKDLRIWRAIEQVAADSGPSGAPRSPTLWRLLDWARTSTHVLHIEMVSPSRLPAGMAGIFRIESIDPARLRHVAVIRLCPSNIRRAKASRGPNGVQSFVRFDGLTEAERYAEVLAHELAHAEYALESPERLGELEVAQRAIAATFSRSGRGAEPDYEELVRRCEKPFAVLNAAEAHAESVEAAVLRELARPEHLPIRTGRSR